MNLTVKKTLHLSGQVTPPGSKSHSIRAILLASLCDGESKFTNLLHCDDTDDAITIAKHLGASISESNSTTTIKNDGLPLKTTTAAEIHSGNSGITTHFVLPILGLRQDAHQPIIINCSPQMRARPIQSLLQALTDLGLTIQHLENDHHLPIRISGKLMGGSTVVDGITSQYLSALLLALPSAAADSEIKVKNFQERPYVDMTLQYLCNQGI